MPADARFAGMTRRAARRLPHHPRRRDAQGLRDRRRACAGRPGARQGLRRRRHRRLVAVHPQIHFAENRRVYSANNGTRCRARSGAARARRRRSDIDVNAAYDDTGATYDAYKDFWNRDSYNNAGAALISTVHYSTNYCNAFWNGTQMVYGDGNAARAACRSRAALDVTAHELTHAVTENESGLIYCGESGGLNEAMSDIFGAFTSVGRRRQDRHARRLGRHLDGRRGHPAAGAPLHERPGRRRRFEGLLDQRGRQRRRPLQLGHRQPGFYLLSQGGTHPRGKSTIIVTGIGMEKAIRIFYKANVDILTSSFELPRRPQRVRRQPRARLRRGRAQLSGGCVARGRRACPAAAAAPHGGTAAHERRAGHRPQRRGGQQKFFKLDVPAGQQPHLQISGGTGDADLYVRSAVGRH